MAIEYVDAIPGRTRSVGRGRVPYPAREIESFLNDGDQKYGKVTIEGKEPKSMAQSFRHYLKRNPEVAEKVAVHLVGGELYLERLD